MSRTFLPCSTRTRSIAPRLPCASAIARATSANAPGRSSRWSRSVALNEAEGCDWTIPASSQIQPSVAADPGVRPDHDQRRAARDEPAKELDELPARQRHAAVGRRTERDVD